MKILFVATVRSHIGQFHMPFIKCLKAAGHEVHAAFKDNSADKPGLDLSGIDKVYNIDFERSPLKCANVKAYFKLKEILDNEHYDVIHCHTPVGGVICRLAAKKARKNGTKVFYTAHGFHFFKGCPLKNRLFFYPVEKLLSSKTDCLFLINNEDYKLAIDKKFKAKKIVQIHGVGVDLERFDDKMSGSKAELRRELNLTEDMFGLIYPADLSYRKNQGMLLEALKILKEKIPNIMLLLPGQPILKKEYEAYAQSLGVSENVKFLGYRRDIPKLIAACDAAVSSSRQEGLPVNIIEAIAIGLPVVATDVRGNSDLIVNGKGGYLVKLNDANDMAQKIMRLYESKDLRIEMGKFNQSHVNMFSTQNVNNELMEIYNSI